VTPKQVEQDAVVGLQYKLWADGELVEETESDEPLLYLHGHDNIITGLERALDGMSVGETKTVVIEPEDAYGEHIEDNIDVLSREDVNLGFEPEPGTMLHVQDPSGNVYQAVVVDANDENITLDYNHPMAGRQLKFEVKVTELRDATDEELEHGHVHTGGHHH
jgi:FKBP-type peptidyl-prolyl cis-trans isomerase SlyD